MNEKFLKDWIMGLLYSCPFRDEAPGCPLKEIRKEDMDKRLIWCKELSLEKCTSIITKHRECLASLRS